MTSAKPDLTPDIAATIGVLTCEPVQPCSRSVRLWWLAALPDDATDALALDALDAIEQRECFRAALHVACEQLRVQHVEIQRQRERITSLCVENRQLREQTRCQKVPA